MNTKQLKQIWQIITTEAWKKMNVWSSAFCSIIKCIDLFKMFSQDRMGDTGYQCQSYGLGGISKIHLSIQKSSVIYS